MDCPNELQRNQNRQLSRRSLLLMGAGAALLLPLSGCSLGVMAGKMLFGDPLIGDDFKGTTGKTLTEKGKKVAVICNAPESVRDEFSALSVDLQRENCEQNEGPQDRRHQLGKDYELDRRQRRRTGEPE
ncbi:MAG: hypothetical protein U0903_21730 [Planctomycetales bacterium]